MQWDDTDNAGFSTGKPWFTVNPNYREINAAAALADPDSVFHYYRKLISLRKTYPVFRDGSFALVDEGNEQVFAYTRASSDESLLVVCNFTPQEIPFQIPEEYTDCILCNYGTPDQKLRPYEARMYLREFH